MKVIYNIGIRLFVLTAYVFAPFSSRVRLWINGQRNWYPRLKEKVKQNEEYIWVHCASLGEFEQGRPVIEALKKEKPEYKVVLSFFSPSGYEIRKDYAQADLVCYLPADTPGNAERFINLINPVRVLFVKYEFWYNYINILGVRGIPLYLVSGIFRPEQHFFKWYGRFFRRILDNFTWFFVQDQASSDLLANEGFENISVAGDTRFDRVVQINGQAKDIPQLVIFRENDRLFLAGSSWKPDEEIMARYINKYPGNMKWVFAPHEIDIENIERIKRLFNVKCVRFSEFSEKDKDARVLILDNIGMLSSAYRYAYIAGIGGGFGKGIHNILEPACWGIPVIFGPNHLKFPEAVHLKEMGGAREFTNYSDFEIIINEFLSNDQLYKQNAETAGKFVRENTGATHKIMLRII